MSVLAVNFHYFGEEQYPRGIYPISQVVFRNQLFELGKQYSFVSQSDMIQLIYEPLEGHPRCQITFDDGLKQQMKAFRVLNDLKIPAVFYVPTLPIFEKKALFVHKLHWIRTLYNDRELSYLLKRQGVSELSLSDEAMASEQYKYDGVLARRLKYLLNFKLSEDEREAFVHKLFTQVVWNEKAWCEKFYMGKEDLAILAKYGALGSHGHSHAPLSQCSDFLQDIQRSKEYLNTYLRGANVSFSYPYGSVSAVDNAVAEAVDNCGYKYAYTMQRGINRTREFENPFLLKRVDTNDAPGGKKPLNLYEL